MNDTVSIIIPTYNRPVFLERSIKSVLNQSYSNLEIIVVDDNGKNSDAQFETIKVMGNFKEYNNIKYIQNNVNMGGAESRNIGVRNAKGYFISFLDDDDVYDKEKIQEQIKVLRANENIDVCYCGMTYLDFEGKPIGKRNIYLSGSEELIVKHIFRPITGTPALLMKKRIFEEINGFDNLKRYQDANLIFKILANRYIIANVKKELVKVYIHKDERISTNDNWIFREKEYIEENLKYIKILSYKNAIKLIDKYHILTEFSKKDSKILKVFNVFKKIKFRVFLFNNFLGVLNYISKS